MRSALLLAFLTFFVSGVTLAQTSSTATAQRNYPAPVEGDYVIPNFHFRSGEVLPETAGFVLLPITDQTRGQVRTLCRQSGRGI